MTRLRNVLSCLLLSVAFLLSAASSGRAVGGALKMAATAVIVAGALAQLSEAVTVLSAPHSEVAVCRVQAGGRLRVLGYSEDLRWAKVRTPRGQVGWVPVHQLPREAQPE